MEMTKHKFPFCLRQRFDNFELFSNAVRGWDVDFRQLDRGRFQAEITQLDTQTVLITEAFFNRRLVQRGGTPSKTWTFGILESSSPDVVWRGQTMSDQMMAVFPPGSEIDASSPPGFHALTLSIPVDVFKEWEALYRMDGSCKIQPMGMLIKVDPLRLAAIRGAARHAVTTIVSGPPLIYETVQDLPNLVVGALSAARRIWPRPFVKKRTHLVKVLTAYIDAHLQAPISSAELCAVSKVSPRTIQYTFMDRFGVSPKQYIQACRLNGVYRDLRKANLHEERISDVANDWGFWHMGQFAADYRRLFGELPSETLNRPNR